MALTESRAQRVARAAVDQHRALQKRRELAGLLEVVVATDPKLIIEIGSDRGGTLWAWSQLAADVVSVTLDGGPYSSTPTQQGREIDRHGADVIVGDSHDVATWLRVGEVLNGRRADLLFIDGDHTYEGARQDVMAYTPFVRPGGYVALHDICEDQHCPEVGVWRLWPALRDSGQFAATEFIAEPRTWGGIGLLQIGTA